METTTKRQIAETFFGKTAKEAAEKRMRQLRINGIAPKAPWYGWSVEALKTGGFGIFVHEEER
jgi:hypothetical protein